MVKGLFGILKGWELVTIIYTINVIRWVLVHGLVALLVVTLGFVLGFFEFSTIKQLSGYKQILSLKLYFSSKIILVIKKFDTKRIERKRMAFVTKDFGH